MSDRIRETERFIEKGFLDGDFLTLGQLLSHQWLEQEGNANLANEKNASGADTLEWGKKVAAWQQQKAAWEAKHGSIKENAKRWIEFLKKCESRIDAISVAFAGIGNDELLAQFLKDERSFKLSDRINAPPELLPQLARISADHWLARFEDLRYHLEWFVRYSRLPTMAEMQLLERLQDSKKQRPTIRLSLSMMAIPIRICDNTWRH